MSGIKSYGLYSPITDGSAKYPTTSSVLSSIWITKSASFYISALCQFSSLPLVPKTSSAVKMGGMIEFSGQIWTWVASVSTRQIWLILIPFRLATSEVIILFKSRTASKWFSWRYFRVGWSSIMMQYSLAKISKGCSTPIASKVSYMLSMCYVE